MWFKKRKFANWRWFLLFVLIALLILIIVLLLREYTDLTYAVARYKAETGEHIQSLTETVNALKTANTGLVADNHALTQQVQELTVKINGVPVKEPVTVNVPSGIETPKHLAPLSPAPIVITTLLTLFNGIRMLVPVLP
jgi:hypothetical protein